MTREIHLKESLVEKAQYDHYSNKISWSKQGHIVYSPIFKESRDSNLLITYLECIDGRTWQLAPPTELKVLSYSHLLNNGAKRLDTSNAHQHAADSQSHQGSRNNTTQDHQNLLPLDIVSFSNTGWDIFTADSEGHVSIIVTGVKKSAFPGSSAGSESYQPPMPPVQWIRTSFNVTELVYTDSTILPTPDLSSPSKKRANQIVAMKWLNIDKLTIVNFPAVRTYAVSDQDKVLNGCTSKFGAAYSDSGDYYYSYHVQPHEAYGTMHPLVTKQACIGIRRNGEVSLWHQEDHGIEYSRLTTSLDLEDDDEVTHSAIGFLPNKRIVISTYCSKTKTIRVFSINVDWGYLVETAKQLAKAPNFRIPENQKVHPTISVKQVSKQTFSQLDSNGLQDVTLLELVSQKHKSSSKLYLLAAMENSRSSTSSNIETTLFRYELEEATEDNIALFANNGNNKNLDMTKLGDLKDDIVMTFKQRVTINDSILSISTINLDTLIAITLSNGEIQVLERDSFKLLQNKYARPAKIPENQVYLPENISSIFDAGFVYPQLSFQPLLTCISPNNCCYVALPKGEKVLSIKCVEQQVHESYLPPKRKGLLIATTVAFSLCHTSACYSNSSTDDFIAAIKTEKERSSKSISAEYSEKLLTSVIQECQRTINLNINIATEQADRMIQNQQLQRVLNLQLSLGTAKKWERTKSGQIAWSLVNLRFIGHSVLFTVLTVHQHIQRLARKGLTVPDTLTNAKTRSDYIMSLLGIVRWCMDYIIWLNKELLVLSNAFARKDQQEIERLMKTSVAVPLILGKIPRSFLLFSLSNVKRLFVYLQKMVEKCDPSFVTMQTQTPDNPFGMYQVIEKFMLTENRSALLVANDSKEASKQILVHPTIESYYRLGAILNNSPVSLYSFEKFLQEADMALHNIQSQSSLGPGFEQQIICQGEIPIQFYEAMQKICEVYGNSVKKEIDIADLTFYDVSWLQLSSCDNISFGKGDDDDDEDDDDYDDEEQHGDGDGDGDVDMKDDEFINVKVENGDQEVKGSQILPPPLREVTNAKMSQDSTRKLIQSNISEGYLLDSLRKNLLKTTELIENGEVAVRKCVRCGAVSAVQDDTLFMFPVVIPNPIFQTYQRLCFCGGPWAQL